MAETEEKEEINYASVVFKTKNHPPPEVKKEDEIVYDEVKTRDKPADTNGIQPHKEANSGRHDRQWACCLGILCIVLLSSLIALGVTLTLSYKNELSQLKENQTSLLADKNNLTKLNHKLSSDNQNLTRERDNLTDQFNNLTQTYAVLESNVTKLTSQNQNLTTQITNLTTQNQQVETQNQQLGTQITNLTSQNQQLTGEKKNLTARIQDMETQWNEQNISRALWSVNLYCPITKDKRNCTACLKGWTHKPPNCYAVNNADEADQRTWDRAQESCKGKNSDLAVIANAQEKTSVGDALWPGIDNNEFWIGLRAENGKWKWLDGSELTENSWIQQPAADGQCAGFLKNSVWRSVNCNERRQWICQQKALTLT